MEDIEIYLKKFAALPLSTESKHEIYDKILYKKFRRKSLRIFAITFILGMCINLYTFIIPSIASSFHQPSTETFRQYAEAKKLLTCYLESILTHKPSDC